MINRSCIVLLACIAQSVMVICMENAIPDDGLNLQKGKPGVWHMCAKRVFFSAGFMTHRSLERF